MSEKKGSTVKTSMKSPKRRKNLEETTISATSGRMESPLTSTTITKVEKSQSLKHNEVGQLGKSNFNEQNLSLSNNGEIPTIHSSRKIIENVRVPTKKRPIRSVSQKSLKTTEHLKLTEKQKSPKSLSTPITTIAKTSDNKTMSTSNIYKPKTILETCKVPNDEFEPSKLTLSERVKLFNEKIATETAIGSENKLHSSNKLGRKSWLVSRSRTQPVTSEELEAAYQKPSPHYKNRHSMFEPQVKPIFETSDWIPTVNDDGLQKEESVQRNPTVSKTLSKNQTKVSASFKHVEVDLSSKFKSSSPKKLIESPSKNIKYDKKSIKTSSSQIRASREEGINKVKKNVTTIRNKPIRTVNQIEKAVRKNERHNKQVVSKNLKKKNQTMANEVSRFSDLKTELEVEKNLTGVLCKADDSHLSEKSFSEQKTINHRELNMKLKEDSKLLLTDAASLTMTRLVQEVSSMELRSINIANRLAALEEKGSAKWKHIVPCQSTICPPTSTCDKNDSIDSNSLQKMNVVVNQRKLAERLEKLETASKKWRGRVAASDAVQYSIHGKMKVDNLEGFHSAVSSPLIQAIGNESSRRKKIPKAERFKVEREYASATTNEVFTTKSVTKCGQTSFSKRILDIDKTGLIHRNSNLTVTIPQTDDVTFATFFSGVSTARCAKEHINLNESDFDVIKSYSELLVQRRKIPTRGRRLKSKNPLRVLAARADLKTEYTEVKTGVAERMMKDLNTDKLAKSSSLAIEALAGLASTEDFTAITLRNAAQSADNSGTMPCAYKKLMLILVKGRRHVQVRLVEPIAASINSGDAYILVTSTEVYNYVGRYSNVIERTRSAEIALSIQKNKDLGCTTNQVITVSEEKPTCSRNEISKFWKSLGIEDEAYDAIIVTEAGPPDEDELYETAVINTNMVYELVDKELVPFTEFWGIIPKIAMLKPSKILVFDFGSEMYIWNGKLATLSNRKLAFDIAKELWKEGYDYSECTVCPLTAVSIIGARKEFASIENKASARPDWCLLLKVTQHMEPVLFKEKFLDWPDFKKVIQTKNNDSKEHVNGSITIEPFNVKNIIDPNTTPVDLILEGSHLGRGKEWFDEELRKWYLITMLSTTVWHVDECSHTLLNTSSVGQFHAGDSYIVRWSYRITTIGNQLSGEPSKYLAVGRDRCAYFIWQGRTATPNEQGTAALLTVELDHEKGPQIQVIQGFEPPAFLNLFSGGMVVHSGNRRDEERRDTCRLYICRGTLQSEISLIEVPCTMQSLRTRCSFVLLNRNTEKLYVWHGRASPSHIRENTLTAADKLKINCPIEAGLTIYNNIDIIEIDERKEPEEFLNALRKTETDLYLPLRNIDIVEHTPRLLHLSSISGEFRPSELLCAHRAEITTPYPFLQIELYQVNQPALFMFDNGNEIWLWQGWWPDSGADDQTGSGAVRWQSERKAAMKTAIHYWQTKYPNSTELPIFLVWAGLEPLEFIHLFPMWESHDDVAELNIQDGHKPGEVLSIHMELEKLTQNRYSPAELTQRPLPQGVDPTRLELYLSADDFQKLFDMTIEDFKELPAWKKIKLKKEIGLF